MYKNGLNTLVITHKPINEIILKRLLLIFDRVTILDPEENNFLIPSNVATIDYENMRITMENYAPLYNGEKYHEDENLLINKFDYAVKKGILKIINLRARNFYEKNWLALRLAYEFDTGNSTLMALTQNLIENSQDYTIQNAAVRGMFVQPEGVNVYPKIPNVPEIYVSEESKKYAHEIQAFSILGKLNHSLMLSGEYNLIPSFVDLDLSKIFLEKFNVAKNQLDKDVRSVFYQQTNNHLYNVQYLLYRISEEILPDEILKDIPIRELIIARNNTFEQIIKLRRKLIDSIKFLKEQDFSYELFNEVENYIAKEIEPFVQEYAIKFKEYMTYFLKISGTFGGISATYSIGLQQLDPFLIAVLSGISGAVGSHISDLPKYVSKRKIQRFINTYSYFFNMR